MVYDKVIEVCKGGADSTESCTLCDRPKTTVRCEDCRYKVEGLRVRKKCSQHPKIIFSMDLLTCPKCKGTNIREIGLGEKSKLPAGATSTPQEKGIPKLYKAMQDEMSARKVVYKAPETQVVKEKAASQFDLAGMPAATTTLLSVELKVPSLKDTSSSSEACICARAVRYVLCTNCGFVDFTGIKKSLVCPQHQKENPGLKECPDCGKGTEDLDEY